MTKLSKRLNNVLSRCKQWPRNRLCRYYRLSGLKKTRGQTPSEARIGDEPRPVVWGKSRVLAFLGVGSISIEVTPRSLTGEGRLSLQMTVLSRYAGVVRPDRTVATRVSLGQIGVRNRSWY